MKGLVKKQEKHNEISIHYESDDDDKVETDDGIFNDPRIPLSISNKEFDLCDSLEPLNTATFDKIEHRLNNLTEFSDLHLNETFVKNQHHNENKCSDKEENKTSKQEKSVTDFQDNFSDDENLKHLNYEADIQAESFMEKSMDSKDRTMWQCKECNKLSRNKGNLKKHVEIHMSGLSYSCRNCDKTFKTRNLLSVHMYTNKTCRVKKALKN